MDLVTGAIGTIDPKLLELLKDEYNLQKDLKKEVKFLSDELESVHAVLRKVAEVPWDKLDEQVKLWARQVREASYDMEDVLDTFLVRVEDHGPAKKGRLKRALKKMGDLFSKGKVRHGIAGAIEDIKKQLKDVAERRARYQIDDIVAKPAATSTIDPRLKDMNIEVTQLIGIDKSSRELESKLLSQDGNDSNGKTKIVSVVGVGGLGKTTLTKAVYDKLRPHFDCGAFVPVGRDPDLKKVLRDILIALDKERYMEAKYNILDERQLINELRDFLLSKRYFIVIDDVWDVTSWEIIKSALDHKNNGSRIIITTRNGEVASKEDVYKLDPLSRDDSKRLFYVRLFGAEGKCPAYHPHEASEKILDKCGGIPLAIITMASLLVGKSREDWFDVCKSPGFYRNRGNKQVAHDTEWILSLSYYDLPSYLRSCLLYLSVYPEDYEIDKDVLIWKWIAEGFVERKTTGTSLFQQGEEYFNQLINRSMIQAVENPLTMGMIYRCRVHDMVLDLIRGLSNEENFVTISTDDEGTSTQNTVRRLAHQNRMLKQAQPDSDIGMAHVRSLVACRCDIGSWTLHPSFKLLRVLDLVDCRMPGVEGWQGLEHLGKLLHLRYLGLRHTYIFELSEEIGKLKFLQVLHLQGSNIVKLPLAVCELTQLIHLHGGNFTRMPDGLRKVTSLEELQNIYIGNLHVELQRQFLKELGNQSELRVLNINDMSGMLQLDLLQLVGNLQKLQHLDLRDYSSPSEGATRKWDTVVLPRHLRCLSLHCIDFPQLPSCISPAHLPCLYFLQLCVDHVDEAGLRVMGGLPELRNLRLETRQPLLACKATVVLGDGFFRKLRSCRLFGWMIQLVANEDSISVSFSMWNGNGATAFGSEAKDRCSRSVAPPLVMPNLQELRFRVPVRALYKDGNGGCDNLELECLPSLRGVLVEVDCDGAYADKVEKAEAELKQAAQRHPNGPILRISLVNEYEIMAQSTDQGNREVQIGLLDGRS
ncbi:unnamed protein product [Urochloa humidicola]